MFQAIYIENSVKKHPRTKTICQDFSEIVTIPCERYGEVFNRKGQSFRLQKKKPSLILAKKFANFVLESPKGFGIGGNRNFYFSHMFNCIFDCRYCFLQGMYRSANYVLFVNLEDFEKEIEKKILDYPNERVYFFSGYDCDSLALEPVTHFVKRQLPFFERFPSAILELRTKSVQVNFLLKRKVVKNCVIAFTLSPEEIANSLEHRVPSLQRRLKAARSLQEAGWSVGLRFEPLIYSTDFQRIYQRFFEKVFKEVDGQNLHSVSLGAFRLPRGVFQNMSRLYPEEKLFTRALTEKEKIISYSKEREEALMSFCRNRVLEKIDQGILFSRTS